MIAGHSGAGKTTLAEEIADGLPDCEFRCEPYMQLEEEGYLFSEIPTADDYIKQFNFSVEQIRDSENSVIFDRCPLPIGYVGIHLRHRRNGNRAITL